MRKVKNEFRIILRKTEERPQFFGLEAWPLEVLESVLLYIRRDAIARQHVTKVLEGLDRENGLLRVDPDPVVIQGLEKIEKVLVVLRSRGSAHNYIVLIRSSLGNARNDGIDGSLEDTGAHVKAEGKIVVAE